MSSVILLHFGQGDQSWRELILEEGEIVVGRGEECELQIIDKEISRNHLRLQRNGDDEWVTDLNSGNGMRLDGAYIQAGQQVPFNIGQEIQIGNAVTKIQFRDQPSQEMLGQKESEVDRNGS